MAKSSSSSYHHGNLKEALIDAALDVITEKGIKAMTIRQVAGRAGVSHTAPYRHFKNKDELLVAVACQGFEMLETQTRKRISKFPDQSLIQFQEAGVCLIEFAIQNSAHYRVMFGSDESKEYKAYKDASGMSFQTLLECILNCQSDGYIKEGDPVLMSLAAWSIVHGFAMLFIDGHIQSSEFFSSYTGLKQTITETLYMGLK